MNLRLLAAAITATAAALLPTATAAAADPQNLPAPCYELGCDLYSSYEDCVEAVTDVHRQQYGITGVCHPLEGGLWVYYHH
ncbi:hypothetical protein [Nocardia takedensis]|uniref:hypothetical protein n=1 Tax=Nocardia takedensis TaxID=259390 RepID=UPI000315E425|nr:hypothetical protein [Nocardia takedensis]